MNEEDLIPPEILSSMLMRMFESAPIAMAITTSDTATSSYVKVNDAYLKLTGLRWADICGKKLTSDGAAIDSPERDRRHRLLRDEGGYVLEEVELVYRDGTPIPTLISAQRTVVNGVSFDVEVIVDISARVKLQREMELALKKAAETDALSGLPNRAAFDQYMAAKIDGSGSVPVPFCLAFIDLNGFKGINDTLGHAAGDAVLKVVAQRLTDYCRCTDFIARLGGDEFVLVIDTNAAGSIEFQQRLYRAMETVFRPIQLDDGMVNIGAAIGVAVYDAPNDTAEIILRRADECMYRAKSSGARLAIEMYDRLGRDMVTSKAG